MTKIQKIDIALIKLQKLLNLAPEEDKEKFRFELSKIVPANASASVHPKIGWGEFDDLIQCSISFKVTPCVIDEKNESLFELYSRLIKMSDYNDADLFNQAFDLILTQKTDKIRMGGFPSMLTPTNTGVITTNFKIIL